MSQELWEDIFKNREWGRYPSENFIRFIARNFYNAADRNAVKVLELGLGTGANLWFCAREGFRVSGIEFTKSGIEFFQKRMRAENLSDKIDKISQGDYLEKLDEFEDEGFDAIVDVCSLACNDLQKTRQIFAKALKKLKIGGKFYSSTIAAGLWGYEASKGQWQQPTKGIYADVGKVRFETKQSVQELYKASDFAIQSLLTQTLENDKILDKLYIIEGVKVLENGGGGTLLITNLELSPKVQTLAKLGKAELWKMSKVSLNEHFALHPKPKFSYENEVYFDKNYGALYGEVFEFSYQKGGLKFKTLGIKQSIANTEFFDIQSPYGYSGFYANTSDEHFLNEALNALKQRASEEKIIAFFLRLHPFDENLAFYQKNLEFFAADRKIILVRTDRALSEIRSDYSPRIKSYVKKARGELDISVADRECAREFHALYAATMQRNNAGEFYFFSQNYFERLFDFADYTLLKASYNGRTLAYASFFLGENFGYYHLSANLNEKNANAALLDYFFGLCSERKISFVLLGGGLKDEDSLFYFKQRFSTLHTDFNIGGIVFDKAAYSTLCEGLSAGQFLAYRFAENGGGGGEPHKS